MGNKVDKSKNLTYNQLMEQARIQSAKKFKGISGDDLRISKQEYEAFLFTQINKKGFKLPKGFDSKIAYLNAEMEKFNKFDTSNDKGYLDSEEYFNMFQKEFWKDYLGFEL